MDDIHTNVIFKYGLEENIENKELFSPGTIYFSIKDKLNDDGTLKERVGKIYFDYEDADGNKETIDMTRLGSTLSINGETFNDGEDLTIDTLKTEYGGTGNTVYESNRILYTGSATEFDTASNIYANDGQLAIGITSDDDITTVLGDNSFVVVRGQAVFKDALTALSLKVIDTTDSIYSGDDNASIYTAGGASIGKQLSVNSVKVDGGNSDAGCTMVYDASTSCLMFNFNGETSSTLLSADSRGW